ncbi:MAG: polysaccharide deacetylase family protein [Lachnospiraceae bacterium]|nr:polysaccharide deacetylase family protein [Lachnospiraceae bacterium]
METEKENEIRDEGGSLRERARESMTRRKKQVRTRIVLLNAAIAMLVIMCVFVVKLVSLNKPEQTKEKKTVEKTAEANSDQEAEKPTQEPSATPAADIRTGTDKWLRKDLDASKPMVALTFDDGPYTPVTKKILSTAKKYDARVTFFVVGNRISNYSDVLKKAYDQGCQIASHTHEHKILTKLTKKQIKAQINRANAAIKKVIGCKATALRPPGGGVNDTVRKYVGLPMICWDVDTEDWKSRNAGKVLKRCKNISDGDIVLMHDLYPSSAEAVKKLIPRLVKKGFQLVTVDELFYYKGIKLQKGKVYFSAK